ncbi:MAG: hypothetical protein ACRD17_03795 [Terriglobales bacterium]
MAAATHKVEIRYRNQQGTLLRILSAVSRRGLDFPYVLAEPAGDSYRATLLLEVNATQLAQLGRDWRSIVDVVEVCQPVPAPGAEPAPPPRPMGSGL